MTDYGHELKFGTFITPTSRDPHGVVELAQLSDRLGFDLVTFQDHPYQPALLDAWSLLAFVAAKTERVHLSANVTNLPLRQPVVLARSSVTIDQLSDGRFELGLGAGGFWDAIEAVGGRRLRPGQAVTALEEAIRVIRAIWAVDEPGGASVDGEFYSVRGAKRGPASPHPIGISLGAYKPRMLNLVGRAADGWIPSFGYLTSVDQLTGMNRLIDEGAESAGRRPADIRRWLNIGAADATIDRLVELAVDHGTSGFILAGDDAATMERFAAEVIPAVRAQVSSARGLLPGSEVH
ncbi:alkanesulfonate monooxygenase SsuD/methylene tetrahydromethanopterin reductase-like flavin-dependent oxidoreductase (luciferase family) [Cryobacterium mesophilum]|uniref:LLM class flavin-dependent oxidoreductase n=1 Tax=Terrimesophilobacter mesophilus TaxID=433647 RepID=A0A4R8VB23_9MICO|nr:LLM class flavin-dependent oxidoreductase [Terrimesophilobacter mesophilus]MBB5632184.1 alkanesulfonate monooxygenase SsuD/methylene tetrahydromethanopterin reductase-like flavin-dependent oxidoreductase (luciferase family) [Terrimesophilobacter mesophilus]TFB79047.1 LLM class flavin-dependent oxidoreductase [Terrimesophilobacter mesophilus]